MDIKFEKEWREEDPTGERCAACSEPIYSKAHVYYLIVNGKDMATNTGVCDACYHLMKDDV